MTGNESRSTLEAWLGEAYGGAGRGAGCPPAESYLDLAEGALDETAAARLEAHAEACPACAAERELARAFASGEPGEGFDAGTLAGVVAEVERGLPVRAPADAAPGAGESRILPFARPVPAAGPAAARPLLRPRPSWMRWAAAALLVLAAGLAYRGLPPSMPPLPAPESGGVVRGGEVELSAPAGDLAELPAELRWEPFPGAARYRVRLLAVDDEVLWEGETGEARVALPADLLQTLHRAVSYRWTVEALDSARKPLALSEPGRFRALPEPEAP